MNRPVSLITGTSRGIGYFLAQHYLELGHQVYGCSRGEVNISHDRYVHTSLNVHCENEVKELFSKIRRKEHRLDHLINNAGVAAMNHALLTPVSTVAKVFETNFLGTFLFCREAAKLMQKSKFGRIVNFVTTGVPLRLEGESIYVSSKAAVLSFTQVLAREVADFGITVNAIGPCPIETDLLRGIPEDKLESLISRQAFKAKGTFQDVANIVDFYLKPESAFLSGQCLFLGGVS